MERIFLALVGLLYAGLAAWCTISPKITSNKVGFDLQPGSGESEFVTVYGGLEMGMALIFLLPLLSKDSTSFALLACLLMHLCLVVFRSYSFMVFSGIGRMTYQLAVGEWVILLLSLVLYFWPRSAS
jgi:hypothetical protein